MIIDIVLYCYFLKICLYIYRCSLTFNDHSFFFFAGVLDFWPMEHKSQLSWIGFAFSRQRPKTIMIGWVLQVIFCDIWLFFNIADPALWIKLHFCFLRQYRYFQSWLQSCLCSLVLWGMYTHTHIDMQTLMLWMYMCGSLHRHTQTHTDTHTHTQAHTHTHTHTHQYNLHIVQKCTGHGIQNCMKNLHQNMCELH